MKKITRKLSMKYVKLNKSRLRQEGPVNPEDDGGEIFRENHLPENEESNETKETPRVTKLMETLHRKLMLNKDKSNKKNIHVDGDDDQSQISERSIRNGGRDRNDDEGSVRISHMQHLEDLIRDHMDSPRNKDQVGSSKGCKSPCDFDSKKDYLDWIEYVEGSSHHCFDRTENSRREFYRRDDYKDNDQISVGVSEGSVEGNNDEMMLLKSSKYNKNEMFEDLKGYKKGKGNKSKVH